MALRCCTRGRRGVELTPAGESLLDHARIVMHNVEAMRGDLASFASGAKASVRFLANTSGLSEYLPKALAAFLSQHPRISIDVEERESVDIAQAIASAAPPISGLPPNTRCPTASSGSPSAKTAWCWSPRAGMNWRTGGRSISATWSSGISSA